MEVARYMNEHLRDSRLVVVDTVGHLPQVTHPDAVVAAIRGFV